MLQETPHSFLSRGFLPRPCVLRPHQSSDKLLPASKLRRKRLYSRFLQNPGQKPPRRLSRYTFGTTRHDTVHAQILRGAAPRLGRSSPQLQRRTRSIQTTPTHNLGLLKHNPVFQGCAVLSRWLSGQASLDEGDAGTTDRRTRPPVERRAPPVNAILCGCWSRLPPDLQSRTQFGASCLTAGCTTRHRL